MTPAPLTRRAVLAAALATGGAALLPSSPALAAAFVVGANVRATYAAAGGAAVFGLPLANETASTIDGTATFGQAFERGRVWFAAGKGKVDVPGPTRVRLDVGTNFRPVLGVHDVWRTNDLDRCTPLDKRIVRGLGIRSMIGFNGGNDPAIPGVTNYSYPISSAAGYRGYVTDAANRAAIGKTFGLIASSTSPVLVHCYAGKDRTGWVSELLQRLGGVSQSTRDADYLATRRYSGEQVELPWLQSARDQLATSYGTVDTYLTTGCGLTTTTLAALRRRLSH